LLAVATKSIIAECRSEENEHREKMLSNPTFGGYMTLFGERTVRLAIEELIAMVLNLSSKGGNQEFCLLIKQCPRMKTISNASSVSGRA